jgi:peptidyl-prolyl cis-trans isomerase SurA
LQPPVDSVPMIKFQLKNLVVCSTLACSVLWPAVQAQGLRASPSLSAPRAASDNTQRSADYIVAIVNSEPITNSEVRARVLRFEQQLSQRGGALPARAELSVQVLERLISERAQVQVGRDNGIKIDETMVNGAVQNVARQNQLSVDELRRRLEAEGISYTQFRAGLRDEMLLARVREREVDNRVQISETELDQFIAEQQDGAATSPAEINLAQILITVPETATAQQQQELQARADTILRRARAGEDFAALAREFSQSNERANGGVMGLRSAERYPSLFVEATQSLQVGQLSALVRSGAGFHILKLVDKQRSSAANVTVVQTRARHILLRPSGQLSESAARARLVDLRSRITGGQIDFATAARDNSQDGSAREGGDLGWANPGQFVPEFEEVMNQLAPGQVSEPLVSRFGVHLIQLQERRESALSAREQRELARASLREKKVEEAFAAWAREVRARAYVEMREPPQ